jgi:hypothetical protein
MYYGHSPDGFSQRNVFNFQTRSVLAVYDALNENQRRAATMAQYVNPRELEGSIRFRREGYGGVAYRDLTADQKRLIDTVMRDLISPFRREDGDEVMDLIRRNGGMDRIHLGFFKDENTAADRWDFWRLEGPGFVWNYRVLPHVHCYVNIALQAPANAPPPGGMSTEYQVLSTGNEFARSLFDSERFFSSSEIAIAVAEVARTSVGRARKSGDFRYSIWETALILHAHAQHRRPFVGIDGARPDRVRLDTLQHQAEHDLILADLGPARDCDPARLLAFLRAGFHVAMKVRRESLIAHLPRPLRDARLVVLVDVA